MAHLTFLSPLCCLVMPDCFFKLPNADSLMSWQGYFWHCLSACKHLNQVCSVSCNKSKTVNPQLHDRWFKSGKSFDERWCIRAIGCWILSERCKCHFLWSGGSLALTILWEALPAPTHLTPSKFISGVSLAKVKLDMGGWLKHQLIAKTKRTHTRRTNACNRCKQIADRV